MQREKSPANHLLTQIPSPVSEKDKKKKLFAEFHPKNLCFNEVYDKNSGIPSTFQKFMSYKPKNLFEWKEEVQKQKYDKPVTLKIGLR